jgi:3-oxoadipate enol-lactonase
MISTINSTRFYYEEHGSGFPIILLHGFPLNHTIWQEVVTLLGEDFRVITPDLRGHGRSDCPEGSYTMTLIAKDIAGLMDRFGVEKAVVVGHSMGGYAALAFALAFPERLAGLGLVATQAAADTPERKAGRYASIEVVKRAGVQEMANSMSERLTTRPDLIPAIRAMILSTRPEGVIGSLLGLAERSDLTGQLASIQVPALVVAGDADRVNPIERSREMAMLLPHATLVVIPGAGHMPMMEAPKVVADGLKGLISSIGAASSLF